MPLPAVYRGGEPTCDGRAEAIVLRDAKRAAQMSSSPPSPLRPVSHPSGVGTSLPAELQGGAGIPHAAPSNVCPRRQEERSQGLRAKRGLPCKGKRERRMEQGDTRESCADTWRQATSAELQSGRCGRVVRSARPFRDAVLVKPGRPPSGRAHVCRLSRHLSRSGCKGAGRRGQSRSDKLGRSGNSGKRPRQELLL